jgi:hypothetical protein
VMCTKPDLHKHDFESLARFDAMRVAGGSSTLQHV